MLSRDSHSTDNRSTLGPEWTFQGVASRSSRLWCRCPRGSSEGVPLAWRSVSFIWSARFPGQADAEDWLEEITREECSFIECQFHSEHKQAMRVGSGHAMTVSQDSEPRRGQKEASHRVLVDGELGLLVMVELLNAWLQAVTNWSV